MTRMPGRILMVLLSLPVLVAGSYGLMANSLPGSEFTDVVQGGLHAFIGFVSTDPGLAIEFEGWLDRPVTRSGLLALGLLLLGAGCLPRRAPAGRAASANPGKARDASLRVDKDRVTAAEKRGRKRIAKQARSLAREGEVLEAAQLLVEVDELDAAAEYFVEAEAFVRAAQVRHGQGRLLEAAELFLRGGDAAAAGALFAEQEEFGRAAECYAEIGSTSVAAEMYEKGGEMRRAAECYEQADFLRDAAAAYVRCKAWMQAAACLEKVYREESPRNKGDAKFQQDLTQLVLQAAKLYQRAERFDKALDVLERGRCCREAAQVALLLQQYARAAELFQDAGEPERAARALRSLGEDAEAARILANLHRDRGEAKQAAEYFEEAGDDLAAGDLYGSVEAHDKAGDCFMRRGEFLAAAEMYFLAEDQAKAAHCYEEAGHLDEAARFRALLGEHDREADLLDRAGRFLASGQIYHRQGMGDEAIDVLQKVESTHEDFSQASALLGDIFSGRRQSSLAIKKLKQAIGGRELDRDNLPVYYTLATVYDANDDVAEALEVFEKILAFDYHYRDVEERLAEARERLETSVEEIGGPEDGSHCATDAEGQPGRYQIVGELGRGGMGIVYKAKDTSLDRLVAYKVLPDSLQEDPQALKNFLREAKAAAKLNHPNIVTVYDMGAQGGRYYIAMEYVEGTTLKEILRRRGSIAAAGVLQVLVHLCEALAYAHDRRVVHRDVKTANVMWTRDKHAKLMDFGLAKVIEGVRNRTTVVSGTPYYMSPEQTLGKDIDQRTDLYSLGVTLFELAVGTVPFQEGNIPYHHVHTQPPDVRDLQPELPTALSQVINRCLLKDPAARYQSANQILDEVRGSLGPAPPHVAS